MAADACDICYSIVVPVFNQEAVLPVLLRRLDILMDGLDGPAETIFVDDATTDCSPIRQRLSCGASNAACATLPFGAQYVACGGV
jgi:hypothetical protein